MGNLLSKYKLQTKIIILASGLVLLSIVISGMVLIGNFTATLEKELGFRALAIARTVAQMKEIQEQVGEPDGHLIIQPIAERVRLATNVEYIVVIDLERIRYSHPIQERIGGEFAGGDEGPALADHEYISKAAGILGPSVRAFVPIKVEEGTRQTGVVIVGILMPTIAKILLNIKTELYLSLLAGIIIGTVGAVLLARNIKKSMFNLEPVEIARILEERIAVFQSIREGILAIDKENKVTVVNEEAKRMLGFSGEIIGQPIEDFLSESQLPWTAALGVAAYNQERIINGNMLLVNRVPIRDKGKIIGAVSTIRDKTEVKKLAEELTGVKVFIEALRVQNHEYMNKLHTIAGLVQLKKYEKAMDYIFEITEEQQSRSQFLNKNIKEYSIAGLLLGKYSRSKELKIELEIDKNSKLDYIPAGLDSDALGIILGNLLENALEAVRGLPEVNRWVYCLLKQDGDYLLLTVKDKGHGISSGNLDKIFLKGFSTKGSENRGIGLALVKQYVEMAQGKITVRSQVGIGTEIIVEIGVLGRGR